MNCEPDSAIGGISKGQTVVGKTFQLPIQEPKSVIFKNELDEP